VLLILFFCFSFLVAHIFRQHSGVTL